MQERSLASGLTFKVRVKFTHLWHQSCNPKTDPNPNPNLNPKAETSPNPNTAIQVHQHLIVRPPC